MQNASILRGRAMYIIAFASLLAASLLPALIPQRVDAAQLTSRSVVMNSSVADASTAYDGTSNVVYEANFTLGTTGNVGGVVVDFCQNNPIIGDSCTAVTGLDIDSAALSDTFSGTFSKDATNSDADTLVYTNGTPVSESGAHTITFDGVTNPSSGPFYARILTYTTEAAAQGYTDTAPGSTVDEGGVAMDLADGDVTVTAKVHETLTFCVYETSCGSGDGAVELGDSNGVLADTGTVYTDNSTSFEASTNANSGVEVRLFGDTLKDGNGNDIDAAGGTSKAFTGASGTEEFGVDIDDGGNTNLQDASPYGTTGEYALLADASADSVNGTNGDVVATSSGPHSTEAVGVTFAAQASDTTPAGVYTQTFVFVATGTF